ncbi:MAG: 16S rRNA (uracil(1498)-N(3))-methyltransferase [Deltaproteobacteria bacterium]|jgi:16S rRNA (uracil1498-N3)-methyltransferase|nr:16S rRNA (uracil(1498)-N(3))-methyltransferase [Deltaproteobacteria bacterium]
MRIPKIIVDFVGQAINSQLLITGQNYHHLINVLRCKVTDVVEVASADNSKIFKAQITTLDIKKNSLLLNLLEEIQPIKLNAIDLICGFPKPTIAEFIVEKSVEIGVSNIHFFFAERSQSHLQGEQLQKKLTRLNKIKEAALKQSGLVSEVTKIYIHNCLQPALAKIHSETLKIVLIAPAEERQELLKITDFIKSNPNYAQQHQAYSIIIGPEGGLSPSEIALAQDSNFIPTSLGKKTLRVETAVIASCALLQLL